MAKRDNLKRRKRAKSEGNKQKESLEEIDKITAEVKEEKDTATNRPPTKRIESIVIVKLVIFSLLAVIIPLGLFYATQSMGFSSTFSGITAGIAANLVLMMYVVVAYMEED